MFVTRQLSGGVRVQTLRQGVCYLHRFWCNTSFKREFTSSTIYVPKQEF